MALGNTKHDRNSGDGKAQYGNAEGCGRTEKKLPQRQCSSVHRRGVIYFCWCGWSWKGRRQSAGARRSVQEHRQNAQGNGTAGVQSAKRLGGAGMVPGEAEKTERLNTSSYAFGAIPENELLRIKGHSKIKCAVKWAKKGKSAVEIASMYGILRITRSRRR